MGASVTLTPSAYNIINQFDYFGMLLGLPRLPGEKNPEYKKRLIDVYTHRASATERGLVNGITRELGLERFNALTINSTSPNIPRIIVRDTQIELYSNWTIDEHGNQDCTLDETIDIYSVGSDAYFIPGLISAINATSYFTAIAADLIDDSTLSATLLNADSRKWASEVLKPFHRQQLKYSPVIQGTVSFSFGGSSIFVTEKETEEAVTGEGHYYIDYSNGFLVNYSLPTETVYARYMYDELPLTLEASPVILHEFFSPWFLDKMFEQTAARADEYLEGLPTDDMVEMILELHRAAPMLWGR